jgi:rRNA maturation protein Nop10
VTELSYPVLPTGTAGRYTLVQCPQFGWLDIGGPHPGRFTPLPGQVITSAAW